MFLRQGSSHQALGTTSTELRAFAVVLVFLITAALIWLLVSREDYGLGQTFEDRQAAVMLSRREWLLRTMRLNQHTG